MDAIVINPAFNTGRRRFQQEQLSALGINAEYLAVSVEDLSDELCRASARIWTRAVRRTDIACFQSHVQAWRRVVETGVPMLILEDDAILSPRIKVLLDHIEAQGLAPDTIYDLEYVPRPHLLGNRADWAIAGLGQAIPIYQNKNGLGAYVIGPQAAARMIAEAPVYAMVDAWFWTRRWPQYLQIEPALAVQMVFVRDFPEPERLAVAASSKLFKGPAFFPAKLRRLRLKWNELPRFLRGLRVGSKRKIAIDRDEFRHGAGIR